MTEKEMEDLIAAYPDDFFFQHQLVLRGRQQSLGGVGRFDLLFEDRFKSKILMELKAHTLNYENATQVANYRDELRRLGHGNVVMWLVAPQIPHSVREFLDDKGIQYTEINVAEFRRVAERHEFVIKSEAGPGKFGVGVPPGGRGARDDYHRGYSSRDSQRTTLSTVDVRDFLQMELPPLEYVVDPLLTVRGRSVILSPPGPEKAYVTMQLAYSVACGIPCFRWKVPRARRVVYVEGEMDVATLQKRQKDIALVNEGRIPEPDFLHIFNRDLQADVPPKINSPQGRAQIEARLSPGGLLILDNLASYDENEPLDRAQIEGWTGDLSRNGISTIFVSHSGKGGRQRGTPKREELFDAVLRLRLPVTCKSRDELRCEVEIEKIRGQAPKLSQNHAFELSLNSGPDGKRTWMMRPLGQLLNQRAKEMLIKGIKPSAVVAGTGLSRATVYRIRQHIKGLGS
jgi:AAA domain/Endonuclease NucS